MPINKLEQKIYERLKEFDEKFSGVCFQYIRNDPRYMDEKAYHYAVNKCLEQGGIPKLSDWNSNLKSCDFK
jgi:hypothetical protein